MTERDHLTDAEPPSLRFADKVTRVRSSTETAQRMLCIEHIKSLNCSLNLRSESCEHIATLMAIAHINRPMPGRDSDIAPFLASFHQSKEEEKKKGETLLKIYIMDLARFLQGREFRYIKSDGIAETGWKVHECGELLTEKNPSISVQKGSAPPVKISIFAVFCGLL